MHMHYIIRPPPLTYYTPSLNYVPNLYSELFILVNCVPYSAKHWRGKTLANLVIVHRFAKVFPSNIVNTLKCNGKPTRFAKVLPSNYTRRVISPKFHPANILRYTVLKFCLFHHVKPHYYVHVAYVGGRSDHQSYPK